MFHYLSAAEHKKLNPSDTLWQQGSFVRSTEVQSRLLAWSATRTLNDPAIAVGCLGGFGFCGVGAGGGRRQVCWSRSFFS